MSAYYHWLLDAVFITLIAVVLAILAYRRATSLYEQGVKLLDAATARLEAEVSRNQTVEISLRERISALEGHTRP